MLPTSFSSRKQQHQQEGSAAEERPQKNVSDRRPPTQYFSVLQMEQVEWLALQVVMW